MFLNLLGQLAKKSSILYELQIGKLSYAAAHPEHLAVIDNLILQYLTEAQAFTVATQSGKTLEARISNDRVYEVASNLKNHVIAELKKLELKISDPLQRESVERARLALENARIKLPEKSIGSEIFGQEATYNIELEHLMGRLNDISGLLNEVRLLMSLNNAKSRGQKVSDFFTNIAPELNAPDERFGNKLGRLTTPNRQRFLETEIDVVSQEGAQWQWSEIKSAPLKDPDYTKYTEALYKQARDKMHYLKQSDLQHKIQLHYYFPRGICVSARRRLSELGIRVHGPEIPEYL